MNKPELLAPAGDLEKLKYALLYGADAVYVGGKQYSLRANANNFSLIELKEAAIYTHQLNKKIYVTVNIIFHDEDFNGLIDYLYFLKEINIDGIIIADLSLIKIIKEHKINIPIIVSTQSSVHNVEAIKYLVNKGVKRIVMARETSYEDLKEIMSETDVELECFIHGAMCCSFSGRCVLSNYATNRDSNRGGCAQICRWVFNGDNMAKPFAIAPKDLNMVKHIKTMIEIGIASFKIEGRMRSIYYLGTVISVYREIIDRVMNNSLSDEYINYYQRILNRCANRESTDQFYTNKPGVNEQYYLDTHQEESNQDFLGIVIDYDEVNKQLIVEQRNYFKVDTVVEIFGPKMNPITFTINQITDEHNNIIYVANHPQMIVKIPFASNVPKGSFIRLKVIDFLPIM